MLAFVLVFSDPPLVLFVMALAFALSGPVITLLHIRRRRAELQKDYDLALQLSEQAMAEDPSDHRYELAVRRLRFMAAQTHVDQGRRLREEGLLTEAVEQFQRAVELDPASTVAAQQLKRTLELIEKRQGGEKKSALDDNMLASALEQDRAIREEMVDSLKEPPLLKPLSNQHIDLMMSEQSKIVFETIAKLAGINVLFDPDFQDKKIDIEIRNAHGWDVVGGLLGDFADRVKQQTGRDWDANSIVAKGKKQVLADIF